MRTHTLLFLILLFAALLRFLWLEVTPPAIMGDELIYIITAKAFVLTGADVTGSWHPFSLLFFQYPPQQMQAELPYILALPAAMGMFSLIGTKLLYAAISVATVWILYLIGKTLGNKQIGLITACIAAINPWFIVIGRTSYEVIPATFFYLCAFYVLIKAKGRNILWSLPLLFLAFYSYIGTKLLFIPFVLVTCSYAYYALHKKKFLRQYITVCLASLLLVAFFFLAVKLNPAGSRMGELFTPFSSEIAKQVIQSRHTTIHSPLTPIFENKFTLFGTIFAEKFFNIFSSEYLFTHGDSFFGLWNHGLFYYPDAVFLIIGIVSLYQRNRKLCVFLLATIGVSILPHLFHKTTITNFTPHLSLLFPFFILFIAWGIYTGILFFKAKTSPAGCVIVILYLISLGNFITIYFFQYPLRDNTGFPTRAASRYISLVQQENKPITVYSNSSSDMLYKYLFYSNAYTKETAQQIRQAEKSHKYTLHTIHFVSCDNTKDFSRSKEIIIYDSTCGKLRRESPHRKIANLSDGGEAYRIYNDTLCQKMLLHPYPSNISLTDLQVEKLSKTLFCQKFINQ